MLSANMSFVTTTSDMIVSHTGVNVDGRVDRANLVLSGRGTAQVETSVVLVLKSSNRRDKRRSSDDGGLHVDVGLAMDPVLS